MAFPGLGTSITTSTLCWKAFAPLNLPSLLNWNMKMKGFAGLADFSRLKPFGVKHSRFIGPDKTNIEHNSVVFHVFMSGRWGIEEGDSMI